MRMLQGSRFTRVACGLLIACFTELGRAGSVVVNSGGSVQTNLNTNASLDLTNVFEIDYLFLGPYSSQGPVIVGPVTLSSGPQTYSFSSTSSFNVGGFFGLDSSGAIVVSFDSRVIPTNLNFDSYFGFSGANLASELGENDINGAEFTQMKNLMSQLNDPQAPSFGPEAPFFGESLAIIDYGTGTDIGTAEFSTGDMVPEPLGLSLMGLSMLGLARRR